MAGRIPAAENSRIYNSPLPAERSWAKLHWAGLLRRLGLTVDSSSLGLPMYATACEEHALQDSSIEKTMEGGIHPVILQLQEVESLVNSVMASWHGSSVMQNRRWHRVSYQRPIAVTPLDAATDEPVGATHLAQGADLSLGGVAFSHSGVLPCRKIAITFFQKPFAFHSVGVRLTWCRFTSRGIYRSGGTFCRVMSPLIASLDDWDRLPSA